MENLKDYFDQQKTSEGAFNIFRVLHEETDEKRLHSRFISFLLSYPDFLRLFLEKVGLKNFETDNCIVRPKITDKSEYEDIDILLYNCKQAIIIENKIFAGESNLQDQEEGYNGQLERYFNTIKTGINKDRNRIEIGNRKVVSVIYLTLDRHGPSVVSLGKGKSPREKLKLIDYPNEIKDWLDACIAKTAEAEVDLQASILQYRTLVVELSSDLKQAKENKERISGDIEKAWQLQDKEKYFSKNCFNVFKHVKWQTVADFFNELSEAMNDATNKKLPEPKDITKVTHKQNGKANTKLILKFTYGGQDLQIVNDTKGFTLGNLTMKKWDHFYGKFEFEKKGFSINDIKFCDFSNEATFRMINEPYRKQVIEELIKETKEKYQRLENKF
jgi:hypothetical protein